MTISVKVARTVILGAFAGAFGFSGAFARASASLQQGQPSPQHSAATQHRRTVHHHHRTHLASRPEVQPLSPAPTPVASNTAPAPVPNENVGQPKADNPPPSSTSVEPQVFQLHYPPQGEGYVTGSSPQAMDDRNAAKATGVQMQMPLPQ